jgi:hypothetical protein
LFCNLEVQPSGLQMQQVVTMRIQNIRKRRFEKNGEFKTVSFVKVKFLVYTVFFVE